MKDFGRIVVPWAHVVSGVPRIGGGFYATLVRTTLGALILRAMVIARLS